jgi:uncharacterized protein
MEQYEWDEAKNQANRVKHGFGFEIVYEFDWSRAKIETDERYDYGEVRGLAYGRINGRGFAIVFTDRGERMRVISLRPMHERELKKHGL